MHHDLSRKSIIQIGRNLRALRERAGMSQQELAACLDISYQQLQKYETGVNRVSLDKLLRLRRVLRAGYEEFFAGLDDTAPSWEKISVQEDPLARAIYWKVSAVKDHDLRQKIRKVVNVLAG